MYAQIPAELMQKQYVTMAPGQFGQMSSGQLPPQFQGQQLSSQFHGQLPQHLQGQLPGGMIANRAGHQNSFSGVQRVLSPQQQYLPPNMMPTSPTGGNFVYTRRIIDPTNHSVLAEERIGQDEYHRGIGNIDEPGDADYWATKIDIFEAFFYGFLLKFCVNGHYNEAFGIILSFLKMEI